MGRHKQKETADLTSSLIDKYLKHHSTEKKDTTRKLKHLHAQRRYLAKKKREANAAAAAAYSMLESPEVVTIKATQKTSFQIVPNFQFDYELKREVKEFADKPVDERDRIAMKLSLWSVNGNNKKQRPRGLGFTAQAFGKETYVIDTNHDINVTDEMEGSRHLGKQLSISVRYLNVKNGTVNEFIVGARGVSQTWTTEGNKTNRSVINGGMKHFGTMRGAGNQVEFYYAPTRHNTNGVNSWHAMTNVAAKSIAKRHFPKVLSDIQSTMKTLHKFVPDKIGGKKGLCCEMVQSQHALVTEPHVDLDCSKCLSIWTVESGKDLQPEGWYFVLPYMTCKVDGKMFSGIAIKLRHGTGIEWDGRYLFHCSTSPNDKTINVHGTFFGVTKV